MTNTIATEVKQCLYQFEVLLRALRDEDGVKAGMTDGGIADQLARFKVWAGNIGAHRAGTSSLDYRLRDASNIRKQVVSLLTDLEDSLRDAYSIVRGETLPLDESAAADDASSSSDEEATDAPHSTSTRQEVTVETEMAQISAAIMEVVDCLFRLSVAIRNPAPHDRLKRVPRLSLSALAYFDRSHVREKFRLAPEDMVEKLALANSRRRQYLEYRKSHHETLAQGLESGVIGDTDSSTVASSIPHQFKDGHDKGYESPDEDTRSRSDWSDTSYASSLTATGKPKVPPLPAAASLGPFQCPYCFMMISISTEYAWRQHVFSDLRPFICLYPDCETPEQDYARLHHCMQHVKQQHWRIWSCPFGCSGDMQSARSLNDHLSNSHGDQIRCREHLRDLLKGSHKPDSAPETCPLCQESLAGMKKFVRHVGRHQRDLALFVLPTLDGIDDELEPEIIDSGIIRSIGFGGLF
ncbi:hypothetical protein MFIFM68171_04896 [Madurella fahalii]|uniref:C2H2-type domain-containing protein n=1 Tax=Madurella fahalii TaxID=1157608 RepID=A0ABQ0GA90_9PEZI